MFQGVFQGKDLWGQTGSELEWLALGRDRRLYTWEALVARLQNESFWNSFQRQNSGSEETLPSQQKNTCAFFVLGPELGIQCTYA